MVHIYLCLVVLLLLLVHPHGLLYHLGMSLLLVLCMCPVFDHSVMYLDYLHLLLVCLLSLDNPEQSLLWLHHLLLLVCQSLLWPVLLLVRIYPCLVVLSLLPVHSHDLLIHLGMSPLLVLYMCQAFDHSVMYLDYLLLLLVCLLSLDNLARLPLWLRHQLLLVYQSLLWLALLLVHIFHYLDRLL